MTQRQDGLLAQLEAGVLDDKVSLSSLLQKCIVLGGQAGSTRMREWARRELNGYVGKDDIPEYRRIPTILIATITNNAGYHPMPQQIRPSDIPKQIREMIEKDVDIEIAVLGGGVGELEALARQGKAEHHIIPSWEGFIQDVMNKHNMAPNSRIAMVYWSVPNASIEGLLVRIRTALAELVAELDVLMPEGQVVPDKLMADQVTQLVISGDRAVIHQRSQQVGGGDSIGSHAVGPVTISGDHGTAIGSQTASGNDSSMVGSQAVHGDHSAVTGRDASAAARLEAEGWWRRLRKRGAVVAFSTIIGAIAAVIGSVVAVLAWTGWTPWR
ncbi:MAG: AbiTii protein [Actinomycetota bacterium]|nr:AbiTii protein [Actinomycetota bacterium]